MQFKAVHAVIILAVILLWMLFAPAEKDPPDIRKIKQDAWKDGFSFAVDVMPYVDAELDITHPDATLLERNALIREKFGIPDPDKKVGK
jgi:hypothetical protein